jgi:hypothetical protein
MTEGRFLYDRKRGEEQALADLDQPVGANGGDSARVLEYLLSERSRGTTYDLLLLNCGLHDMKTDPHTGGKQVPPDTYRRNLEEIIGAAQSMAAAVIWVRTTDAVEAVHNTPASGFLRFHEDAVAYNAIADDVMSGHEVPLLDLYTFTQRFGEDAYCDHVHFKEEIRRLQAAFIAGYLERWISCSWLTGDKENRP